MSNDPSQASQAVLAMREDWAIVDALMGGTKAMRAAGTQFLPKWPKEEDDAYRCRLSVSTLLPAYSETVQNMTGRVFAEPIQLGEDVPEQIAGYAQNIDSQGDNLQVWAQRVFSIGLSHGLCYVLVDYASTVNEDGEPTIRNRAEEIAAGVRPYVVLVGPKQVIGWKSASQNGTEVLTQFRYMECVDEPDPENVFATTQVEQIRVLEPGSWATYRKTKGAGGRDEWTLHQEGTTSLDYIPLATFYTKRTGFMTATPPLMELAHLNIKHWQSQSDQDNILHVARVPLLALIGVEDTNFELQIGTSQATKIPKDGDMKFVEHTGKAIEAGRDALSDLVDDMRVAGAKLLQKEKQATKTAAQAEEEAAQEMSPLETMAGQLEDFLDQVLQYMADWLGVDEGGHVEVNGNFMPDFVPEVSIPALVQLTNAGKISDETMFNELQRRGILSPDIDWQSESERIAMQGPQLGTLGSG
ncbi:DUF4055 domain-containing protein [Chitinolyticbacter meiyuanensis]|uniref:DUF4055 domain-containing protein n=1 Tax=Chitinolyticbacter meiyuanensis TaxID=682798 RepID=UPI0011E5BA17|nr:DUF4055 domain-containing protein [Chitinolyticbacter meiyuanensis]